MAFPELTVTTAPLTDLPEDVDAWLLALPPLPLPDELTWATDLAATLAAVSFRGTAGSTLRITVPSLTDRPLFVTGIGADATTSAARDAVGAAVRTTTGFGTVALAAPTVPDLTAAIAEGALLGGYHFDGYKTHPGKTRIERIVLSSAASLSDDDLQAVHSRASAVALVKDLVNIPAEWLGPADLAAAAADAVSDLPISVEVYDEHRLREEGFGGILGVGQGSSRPPRFVHLDYHPADAARHVAIVGKGITFDTGGLSLKPPASMVGMKFDMAGAAVALAVVRAAAEMRLPLRVSGWLCIADNMPSGSAIRPGDVLRMLDGTSVEVLNTDAEGRLVMADGLVAASRTHPDILIDVATLTGAVIVALGNRHTGVMGEHSVVGKYLLAAEDAGELAWPLPLPDHMDDELDSPIADLQNAKIGDSAGGTLFAGLFLRRFVGGVDDTPDAERIPWIHLDIAGSGTTKAAYGPHEKGPTAASVRSLLTFLSGESA